MPNLLDPKDFKKLFEEKQGQKVLLCCDDHGYYPGSRMSLPQKMGCPSCEKALLWYELCQVKPEKRGEVLDQLEQLVHHMVEDFERGKFDIQTFARPKITTEKVDDDKPNIILTDDASKD